MVWIALDSLGIAGLSEAWQSGMAGLAAAEDGRTPQTIWTQSVITRNNISRRGPGEFERRELSALSRVYAIGSTADDAEDADGTAFRTRFSSGWPTPG